MGKNSKITSCILFCFIMVSTACSPLKSHEKTEATGIAAHSPIPSSEDTDIIPYIQLDDLVLYPSGTLVEGEKKAYVERLPLYEGAFSSAVSTDPGPGKGDGPAESSPTVYIERDDQNSIQNALVFESALGAYQLFENRTHKHAYDYALHANKTCLLQLDGRTLVCHGAVLSDDDMAHLSDCQKMDRPPVFIPYEALPARDYEMNRFSNSSLFDESQSEIYAKRNDHGEITEAFVLDPNRKICHVFFCFQSS